jgi:1-acyl-sn-glycerol-3-phosphate acyltransferase
LALFSLVLAASKCNIRVAQVWSQEGDANEYHLLGWLLTRAGQIPVGAERRERAFDKACELLRQGHTIVLFPEGKLNPSGISMQAMTGAVRMSLAIGAPIIPIGIHVSQKDTLRLGYRSKTGLRTGRWQVRGCCSFQFGERWDPGRESVPGQAKVRARYLTELLMEKIYSLAQSASEECNP